MTRKLSTIFLLGLITIISGCESTGICTEPVTPKLMVGFSADDNLGNEVNVTPPKDLKIYGNRDGKDIIGTTPETEFLYPNISQVNSDKLISLIFDVNRDSAKFIFKFEGDIYDTLKINYLRKQSFVNENCGYKSTFYDVDIKYYSTNKIDTIILLSQTIEYDTEQHIKIRNK
jgi:hypothetical protein